MVLSEQFQSLDLLLLEPVQLLVLIVLSTRADCLKGPHWAGWGVSLYDPVQGLEGWELGLQPHWAVAVRIGLQGQPVGLVHMPAYRLPRAAKEAALATAVSLLHR